VNKFINNRNNQATDIFGVKDTNSSTISSSGRVNKKNKSSLEFGDIKPYNNIQWNNESRQSRANENYIKTDSSANLNISFDSKRKSTKGSRFGDDNEITFGKPINRNKRVASMENNVVDYNKLICNNCLNTQLSTVRKLNNRETEDYSLKQEEGNEFVVKVLMK
jgi:hypothetical protein